MAIGTIVAIGPTVRRKLRPKPVPPEAPAPPEPPHEEAPALEEEVGV